MGLETQQDIQPENIETKKNFAGLFSDEKALVKAAFGSKALKEHFDSDSSFGIARPGRTLASGIGLEYVDRGDGKWSIAVINPRTGKTGVAEVGNLPDGTKFNPDLPKDSLAARKEFNKAVIEAYNKTGVPKLTYDDSLMVGKAIPNPSGAGTALIDARKPPSIPVGELERLTIPSPQGEMQIGARFFLNDGSGRLTMDLEKKVGDGAVEQSEHHFKVLPSGSVIQRIGTREVTIGNIGPVPVDENRAIRLDEIPSDQMIQLKSIALKAALK